MTVTVGIREKGTLNVTNHEGTVISRSAMQVRVKVGRVTQRFWLKNGQPVRRFQNSWIDPQDLPKLAEACDNGVI